MKTRFVYFDLAGILIGGARSRDLPKMFNVDEELFLSIFNKYHHDALRGKISPQELLKKLKEECPIDISVTNFAASWVKTVHTIQPMYDLVVELKKKYRVGLLTNLYKELLAVAMKEKLLPEIAYDAIVESCEVGFMKPENEIYEIAQKAAGVEHAEIFFIDDKIANVEAARALGWQAMVFKEGDSLENIRRELL